MFGSRMKKGWTGVNYLQTIASLAWISLRSWRDFSRECFFMVAREFPRGSAAKYRFFVNPVSYTGYGSG